jgi:hypothetical protein
MKKLLSLLFVTIIVIAFSGCGGSDNSSESSSSSSNVTNNDLSQYKYPTVVKLCRAWGYDWYKITAFYDGDDRFNGNIAEFHSDNEYIVLRAFKKENQDSIAQVSTRLPYVKGFNADINLFKDNIYSKFQVLAIAKRYIETSNILSGLTKKSSLNFIAGLSVEKNKISFWWSIYEPDTMKSHVGYVGNQKYEYNLTDLVTNGSDIKVEVTSDDSTVTYKVYNLANGDVIFEKTLSLSDTKIVNFKGFNIASFRSRVNDKLANENGDDAIDISENIVNDFNAITGPAVSSVDEFLNNLGFNPITLSENDLAGKAVATYEGGLIFFNTDGTYKTIEYDENDSGQWKVEKNVVILDNNDVFVALKDKNGSFINIKGYSKDDGWWSEYNAILNADENTLINNTDDFLALFDSTTPINNLTSSDIAGKTWYINSDINETVTFNSDGNFTDSWNEDGKTITKTGTWSVEKNVLKLLWDENNIHSYVVVINNYIVYIDTDSNGKIIEGGVLNK